MSDLIDVDSHGVSIRTEVFHPCTATDGSAIVLVHGSDGMNTPWADLIRDFAADLANTSFSVFLPRYFAKTGTVPGNTVFAQIPAYLDLWVEAVGDTVAYVKAQPGIDAERVGLLGFSLGGHICLRLRGETLALVEFFAPELGGLGPPPSATAEIEIHHGLADLLVPFSNAEAIAGTLKNERASPRVFAYEGAGHGFAGADAHNATALRSSKYRTLSFFEKRLRSKTEAQSAH